MRSAQRVGYLLLMIGFCGNGSALGASMSTEWSMFDSRSVMGLLGNTFVAGTASELSPFATILGGRFNGSSWQAGMELPVDASGIGATNANDGDSHVFVFSASPGKALFYIENFDANSAATISLGGEGTVSLLSGSPSISFDPIAAASGVLRTSNPTSDGEGDAVLQLSGDFKSVVVDYSGGDGSNGVFYSFVVPEPNALFTVLVALAVLSYSRNRRR